MSREKELIRNTGILLIAKISTQIVSFFLLPLYTAFLTTEEYGTVDVYTSLSMIVIPFLTLQIEMALFRFFITNKDHSERQEIVSSSYAVVVGILLITSIIYWVCAVIFSLPYSGLLYGYYVSQTASAVLLQTCRAQGDNVGYGEASFISSAMAVALNILFIAGMHWRVEGILVSSILSQLMGCIFMAFRTKVHRYLRGKFIKKERIKILLQYSVPLVFNQIASWTINYSDRLLIVLNWGEGANGIYSIANKFSNILNTFFGVYNVAWTENVVRSMEDEDSARYVSVIFEGTFNLYLVLVTGIINLLPFIFSWLINDNFSDAYLHIPILLIAILFSGMAATLGSIYIAYNRTKDVSITTALAGLCNVVIHLLLLQKLELFAASISTLVSFVALFIYRYIFISKFFNIQFHIDKILGRVFILLFAWAAYIFRNPVIILAGFAANLISIVWLFIENRNVLVRFVRKKK